MAVAGVRSYPPVGMGLFGLYLISIWEMPFPPPIVELSGLNVYATDLISLILLVVAVLELTQLRENLGGWLVPWALFGLFIALSLLRGIAAFGLGTAVNEARTTIYVFVAMTWVIAVRPDRLRLHTFSLVLGWALVLVALFHGVLYGIGGASSWAPVGNGAVQTGRVLVATQAVALLLCAATVSLGPFGSGKVRTKFSAVSSFVFGGVVILAQHRSVWVAGAMGVVAMLIWSERGNARKRAFVLLVVVSSLIFAGWSSGSLDRSFESASNTGTYGWRTYSWRTLMSQAIADGPATVVGGEPFGSSFLRRLSNGEWTVVSAHNWYLDIFLRLGVIGLITVATVFVVAFVKSRERPPVCTFTIAAVMVYGWVYSVDWCLAPWFGAAIAVSLVDARRLLPGVVSTVQVTSGGGGIRAISAARSSIS
jgi:hypothetical protein